MAHVMPSATATENAQITNPISQSNTMQTLMRWSISRPHAAAMVVNLLSMSVIKQVSRCALINLVIATVWLNVMITHSGGVPNAQRLEMVDLVMFLLISLVVVIVVVVVALEP